MYLNTAHLWVLLALNFLVLALIVFIKLINIELADFIKLFQTYFCSII